MASIDRIVNVAVATRKMISAMYHTYFLKHRGSYIIDRFGNRYIWRRRGE